MSVNIASRNNSTSKGFPKLAICLDSWLVYQLTWHILGVIYSALSIYRSHFSLYNTREVWGVVREYKFERSFYHCNCCFVCTIARYITAIYRDSIVCGYVVLSLLWCSLSRCIAWYWTLLFPGNILLPVWHHTIIWANADCISVICRYVTNDS